MATKVPVDGKEHLDAKEAKRLRVNALAKYRYHNNPEHRQKKKERIRKRMQNPELRAAKTEYDWLRRIWIKYRMTLSDYESMLAEQGGGCAICQTEISGTRTKRMCIDHDHHTGAVRGLLCRRCNALLGLAGDTYETVAAWIERATAYLKGAC